MIENSAAVEEIFGDWPSFHDAQVLRLSIDSSGPDAPVLDLALHVFERTSDVDSSGAHILKNHTRVTLRFTAVLLQRLQWFGRQNVIEDLSVSPLDSSTHEGRTLRVDLPSAVGMEATFECRRAIVTDVAAYKPSSSA